MIEFNPIRLLQNNNVLIGRDVIYRKACSSTNMYAKELLLKNKQIRNGTVIYTDHQYDGRGQRNSTWHSSEGKNLTFTIILFPEFMKSEKIFDLNILVSVAILQSLSIIIKKNQPNSADISQKDFSIKWPNDIYYRDKKLGGILIENKIGRETVKNSAIGIGLNINQDTTHIDCATSLANIYNIEFRAPDIYNSLIQKLESLLLLYNDSSSNISDIKNIYLSNLYQKDMLKPYNCATGNFWGKIRSITPEGQLVVIDSDNNQRLFSPKEINFL